MKKGNSNTIYVEMARNHDSQYVYVIVFFLGGIEAMSRLNGRRMPSPTVRLRVQWL